MATRVRRLALLAAALAGAFVLSGCHELLRVSLGGADPPVHNPPPAGRPAADASAGRAFTGRADGNLASRVRLSHGFVKSKTSWARFIGSYTSSLTGSPLASAQWHGRFKGVRNRATGKITVKGLVLATFTDTTAGRACLRLSHGGKRKQNRRQAPGRSKLTVLGGEGGARTLRGVANVRVRLKRNNSLRLRGRVKSRQGAARGFTPACRKLEKKFGLQPLPDA
jgi:hypothetical protein